MGDSLSRSLRRTLGYAVLYLLATYAGRLTVLDTNSLSLVWPAAGVLAVWAIAQRRSPWRWVDACVLAGITLAVNMMTGASAGLAAFFVAANLAQAAAFTALMGRHLTSGLLLTRSAELWRLILAAFVSTAIGAAIGPTGIWLVSGHYSVESTLVWLTRNTVSVLLVGVALSRLFHLRHRLRDGSLRAGWQRIGPLGQLEYAAVLALSAVAYLVVFASFDGLPVAFLLIVMTAWAGLRLHTSFVVMHDLTFGTAAILFTLVGTGPFAQIESEPVRALIAQVFVGMVAVVGLALALGRDERVQLVDQLRESEQAAREQAATMTAIVDAMAEGVGVVDEDGRFRLRNPAATHLLGTSSPTGQVGTSGFYGLCHPDGTPLDEDEPMFRRILAGDFQPMDLLVRNAAVPEGRIIHVGGTELPAGHGGKRAALIVFHDVTADRRHRDELASFAGVVAHDLLNPLATIEGWSSELALDLAGDADAMDSIARIQRASGRMHSLIDGLLAYTTARDSTLSPTAVDLDEVVRDIATARLDLAQSLAVPMPRFDIGDLPTVDANPLLTRQLLENLIGNAIKYTASGVVPHITVRSETTGEGLARIAVEDNGIGIPPGQHETIFQNFHRAHAGAGYSGTGLGLAICKRIVERHGGTITAAGNPSGGSRMTFTLPARRGH
ncbi:MAG: ATP-binding protein [Actinoplanes sp.]